MQQSSLKDKKTGTPLLTTAVVPNPSVLDTTASFSTADCAVYFYKEGDPNQGGEVTIRVDPEVMRRISRRANGRDLADYMWEMILKRAMIDHVY